jgi:ankyrin repeat protein
MLAALKGHLDVVALLLDRGANMDAASYVIRL